LVALINGLDARWPKKMWLLFAKNI
jgi:hypothetical protein